MFKRANFLVDLGVGGGGGGRGGGYLARDDDDDDDDATTDQRHAARCAQLCKLTSPLFPFSSLNHPSNSFCFSSDLSFNPTMTLSNFDFIFFPSSTSLLKSPNSRSIVSNVSRVDKSSSTTDSFDFVSVA